MNRTQVVGAVTLVVVALVLALMWWLRSGTGPEAGDGRPVAESQRCAQDSDCAQGMRCCTGQCAAECAAPTPGIAGGVKPVLSPRFAKVNAPLTQIAVRSRDEDLRPQPDGTCQELLDCPTELMNCDGAQGRCQEPSTCMTDFDCLGKRVCQHGRCVEEVEGCRLKDCIANGFDYCNVKFDQCENYSCETDQECAGTRRCDPRQKLCVDCLKNSDCPEGATCTDSWFCLPRDGCRGDGECEPGEICHITTYTCHSAPCVDDDREENDKWSQASPLEPGEYEFMSCPGDSDWHRLDLSKGEGVVIYGQFDRLQGYIDFRMHDVNGQEFMRAGDNLQTGDITMAMEAAPEDSIYYLKVNHQAGIGQPYRLTYTVLPEGFCRNDDYEPNNHFGQARRVPPQFRWDLRLCHLDDDWIKQPLEANERLSVTIDVTDGEPVRVEAFRLGEKEAFWRDDTRRRAKLFKHKSTRQEDIYLRISPFFPYTETRYGVRILRPDASPEALMATPVGIP